LRITRLLNLIRLSNKVVFAVLQVCSLLHSAGDNEHYRKRFYGADSHLQKAATFTVPRYHRQPFYPHKRYEDPKLTANLLQHLGTLNLFYCETTAREVEWGG